MLSLLPPASTAPPHGRSSTKGRFSRSRRRSRFLSFLKSKRFLQSQHEQELSDRAAALDVTDMGAQLQREDQESDMGVQLQDQESDMGVQLQREDQESGSELDSSPRITMFPEPELEKEPDFLASPPRSLCSDSDIRVNSTGLPKDSSNEESPNVEDEYFNYLVDNFVSVAADVCNSTLPDDEPDYKVEIHQQSVLCAKSALRHYNNDEKNKIKYELISGTMCNDMLIREGCFSHLNFTAKANEPNAKEELFFAELRWGHVTPEPTCVICCKGIETIAGFATPNMTSFVWMVCLLISSIVMPAMVSLSTQRMVNYIISVIFP